MGIPCRLLCLLALGLLIQGCSEERPFVPQPSAEYVVMVDPEGKADNILLEQFFKQEQHTAGTKVLVMDKQTQQQTLITPAELLQQNPNAGRYLVFKHDDPERPFDDLPGASTKTTTDTTP
ncbi:hypothetical protein Pan153_02830 [Gimesia panareensis]|uniref:Uncharacterized protein n=1 Tax=Gimesia panareensis TaxID=2527978 RepID=A0A518FH50_9PLAN|nr:hypothetical protein [Gimesia panareensis]QDV15667.1 hypothetical protein Pan153_02830 [Gimesia panareensis]